MRCGALLPDGTDHFEADLGGAVLISDVGLVHSRNEDAVAVAVLDGSEAGSPPVGVAAVVCDGVSTVSRPEEAALSAVEAALDALLQGLSTGMSTRNNHLAAAATATRAVSALDTRGEVDPPACTYVATTLTESVGGPPDLAVSWIGDSRAYWLSRDPGRSEQLTEDDSPAAETDRRALINEVTAAGRPQEHGLTRCLGCGNADDPDMGRPHIFIRAIDRPGVLLLCSDGLWNELPSAQQLADIVFAADSQVVAVRALNSRALDPGGEDNITIVLIEVPAPVLIEVPATRGTTS